MLLSCKMVSFRSDRISARRQRRNSRAAVRSTDTLVPMNVSPSPHCPGPVLKNRADEFATAERRAP